jgi:hypothetical protein
MEHRVGSRLNINTVVCLQTSHGEVAKAEITDLSLSGAFVRTALVLPPSSPVRLTWPHQEGAGMRNVAIKAHVVRSADAGIGIEWNQFGPAPVKAFLSGYWMREAAERVRTSQVHS